MRPAGRSLHTTIINRTANSELFSIITINLVNCNGNYLKTNKTSQCAVIDRSSNYLTSYFINEAAVIQLVHFSGDELKTHSLQLKSSHQLLLARASRQLCSDPQTNSDLAAFSPLVRCTLHLYSCFQNVLFYFNHASIQVSFTELIVFFCSIFNEG